MLSPQQHVSATPQQHVAATPQQQPATQHQEDATPSADSDTASQRHNYLATTPADDYLPTSPADHEDTVPSADTTPADHASLLRRDEFNLPHCAEPKPPLFDRMHEFTVVKVEDDEEFI